MLYILPGGVFHLRLHHSIYIYIYKIICTMKNQKIKVTTAGLSTIETGTTHIPCPKLLSTYKNV